jgi:ubiquinone/menaquinone biosynthesis C-methylase UbiE
LLFSQGSGTHQLMTSSEKSIAAYENEARVASYDSDMDIMHPNRHRMAGLIVEVLTASAREPKLVVDLGTGTGFLLERLLSRFPDLRAIAVDGAQSMTALAKARLKGAANRVDFRVCDFRHLADACADVRSADAVVSMFALHHLNAEEKSTLVQQAHSMLTPGGWFLCGDLVLSRDQHLEVLIQRMRVRGIVERAAGKDPRFQSETETRAFLDRVEEEDNDQPQDLGSDLSGVKAAGFEHVAVLWQETREVVFGGVKGL